MDKSAETKESETAVIWPVLFILALGTIVVVRLLEPATGTTPKTKLAESQTSDSTNPYRGWGRASDIKATTLAPLGATGQEDSHTETVVTSSTVIEDPDPPAKVDRSYIVEKNDTLGGIALKMYGSIRHTEFLRQSNNITNADNLSLGQVLKVPDLPVAPVQETSSQDDWIIHVVKDDENPWKIAAKYYGKGKLYKRLIEDNPDAFNGGETMLATGTRLKIRRQ